MDFRGLGLILHPLGPSGNRRPSSGIVSPGSTRVPGQGRVRTVSDSRPSLVGDTGK